MYSVQELPKGLEGKVCSFTGIEILKNKINMTSIGFYLFNSVMLSLVLLHDVFQG